MTIIVNIFNINPAFTISFISNSSELNTAAFGGVEMGNMKAQVEDTATIPIIMKGSWLIAAANPMLIGINIFEPAVLDITSVRNKIPVVSTITIKINGSGFTIPNIPPNHLVSPESSNAAANERPPPNNSNIPQGSLFISSQTSKPPLCVLAGIKNNSTAPVIAITVSDKCREVGSKPPPIHNTLTNKNTMPVNFSSKRIGPKSCKDFLAKSEDILSASSILNSHFVTKKYNIKSKIIVNGKAKTIHCPNETVLSRLDDAMAANTAFGTEPIKVAKPPIEAE